MDADRRRGSLQRGEDDHPNEQMTLSTAETRAVDGDSFLPGRLSPEILEIMEGASSEAQKSRPSSVLTRTSRANSAGRYTYRRPASVGRSRGPTAGRNNSTDRISAASGPEPNTLSFHDSLRRLHEHWKKPKSSEHANVEPIPHAGFVSGVTPSEEKPIQVCPSLTTCPSSPLDEPGNADTEEAHVLEVGKPPLPERRARARTASLEQPLLDSDEMASGSIDNARAKTWTRHPCPAKTLGDRVLGSAISVGSFHAYAYDLVEVLAINELANTCTLRTPSGPHTFPADVLLCPNERCRGQTVADVELQWPGPPRQIAVPRNAIVRIVDEGNEFCEVDYTGYRGLLPRTAVQCDVDVETSVQMMRLTMRRFGSTTKVWVNRWDFGAIACKARLYCSILCAHLGIAGVIYSARDSGRVPQFLEERYGRGIHMAVTVCAIVLSVAIFVCHAVPIGKKFSSKSALVFRAFFMHGISIFMLFSFFTILPAIGYSFVGVLFGIAAYRGEKLPRKYRSNFSHLEYWQNSEHGEGPVKSPTWCILKSFARRMFGSNLSRVLLAFIWLGCNGAVFAIKHVSTAYELKSVDFQSMRCWNDVRGGNKTECAKLYQDYMIYIPIAKASGCCINLDSAILLLLACQSVLHRLNSLAHGVLACFFGWVPTHRSLILHKFVGATLFFSVSLHVWAHFMAQTFTLPMYSRTIPFYGTVGMGHFWMCHSIWITGGCLCFATIFMFASVGHVRSVVYAKGLRIGGFLLYMLLMTWHGPSFFWFLSVPVCLYVFDYRRKHTTVCPKLLEVHYASPVLKLVFSAPWKYRCGDHIWLHCPSVSKHEWHPFYISSAFESEVLTLYIRTISGGWTEKLRYFAADLTQECEKHNMGMVTQECGFRFSFDNTDSITGECFQGKSTWDGAPLFLLDGPHPGPAIHYESCDTMLFVATGFGLPPMNAVVRQLMQYKWRIPEHKAPRNLYGAWLCPDINTAREYGWFLDALGEYEIMLQANQEQEEIPSVHYEMHMFMTSMANEQDTSLNFFSSGKLKAFQRSSAFGARTTQTKFDADDLLDHALKQCAPSSNFFQTMSLAKRSNAIGSTHAWGGCPDWNQILRRIRDRHVNAKRHTVGIFFCGSSSITRALNAAASTYSDINVKFRVFSEEFSS